VVDELYDIDVVWSDEAKARRRIMREKAKAARA
jgi:hypothetical protein